MIKQGHQGCLYKPITWKQVYVIVGWNLITITGNQFKLYLHVGYYFNLQFDKLLLNKSVRDFHRIHFNLFLQTESPSEMFKPALNSKIRSVKWYYILVLLILVRKEATNTFHCFIKFKSRHRKMYIWSLCFASSKQVSLKPHHKPCRWDLSHRYPLKIF